MAHSCSHFAVIRLELHGSLDSRGNLVRTPQDVTQLTASQRLPQLLYQPRSSEDRHKLAIRSCNITTKPLNSFAVNSFLNQSQVMISTHNTDRMLLNMLKINSITHANCDSQTTNQSLIRNSNLT